MRVFLVSGLLVIAAAVAAQTPSQPTFRSATNLVQVDVVITGDDGRPVEDLTAEDFQVLDDGIAVPIAAFKFLDVAKASGGDRYPVRNASDEEREAARDDTRLFAILLDDYHVARFGPLRIMQPLIDFVRSLRPSDLLAVYYPLDSSRDVHLTYDREAAIAAIRKFEGRLGDYQPKHPVEEEHLRFPRQIERLRTQVVLTGAESLVTHLGGLKIGRKTLVWVTEGFTPAGYEGDAFALQHDIQETYEAANRNNVSIFPVDPRGLMMQTPAFQIEGLKALAAETGGRAIVNRNDLRAALSEVSNEAMAYYLLGFVSAHPADGKFHHITVRTKRRKVNVNARNGYWALSDAEIAASRVAPVVVPSGVTDAFKRMAEALRPEEPEGAPKHAMPKPPAPVITLMGMPTFAVVRGRAPLQIANASRVLARPADRDQGRGRRRPAAGRDGTAARPYGTQADGLAGVDFGRDLRRAAHPRQPGSRRLRGAARRATG